MQNKLGGHNGNQNRENGTQIMIHHARAHTRRPGLLSPTFLFRLLPLRASTTVAKHVTPPHPPAPHPRGPSGPGRGPFGPLRARGAFGAPSEEGSKGPQRKVPKAAINGLGWRGARVGSLTRSSDILNKMADLTRYDMLRPRVGGYFCYTIGFRFGIRLVYLLACPW